MYRVLTSISCAILCSLIISACGSPEYSSNSKCEGHIPQSVYHYSPATVGKVLSFSTPYYQRTKYKNYVSYNYISYCEAKIKQEVNCMDQAVTLRGIGQHHINTDEAEIRRYMRKGVKVGHVIYGVLIEGEWWLFDRYYEYGYPDMRNGMQEAEYLALFHGDVTYNGSYRDTSILLSDEYRPFKIDSKD